MQQVPPQRPNPPQGPYSSPGSMPSPPPGSGPGSGLGFTPGAPPSQGTASALRQVAMQKQQLMQRPIHPDLTLIEKGKVVDRLHYLRENYRKIAPDEMHLMIDPAEVEATAESQFARRAQRLEGWRNGLVLFPLMVTWFSLGLAGIAYAQSLQIDPKLVAEPFLKQWADGFTTITSVSIGSIHLPLVFNGIRLFAFGDIALLDFILLSLLFVLTLRIQRIELQAHRRATKLSAWLKEELFELDKVSPIRSLGHGSENKKPSWAVEVQDAIENLTNTLSGVEGLVRSFETVLQKQSATVDKFIENTKDIGAAIDRLHAIYQHGRESYNTVSGLLPRIHEQFNAMATEEREGARALKSIATEISTASKSINDLARPFAAVGPAGLAQMAQNTAQQMQFITEQQNQTQRSLERLGDRVVRAAAAEQRREKPRPWWDLSRLWHGQ